MGPPGHLAIGFMAKSVAPKAPLWALLLATEILDLLSFVFLAIGVEKAAVAQTDIHQGYVLQKAGSISWSHGLFMSIIWSVLISTIVFLINRNVELRSLLGL